MKKRIPKDNDQDVVETAFDFIRKATADHPLEPTLRLNVCLSCIVQSFLDSGHSYADFKEEMENAIQHYAKWFEGDV